MIRRDMFRVALAWLGAGWLFPKSELIALDDPHNQAWAESAEGRAAIRAWWDAGRRSRPAAKPVVPGGTMWDKEKQRRRLYKWDREEMELEINLLDWAAEEERVIAFGYQRLWLLKEVYAERFGKRLGV